MNKSVFLSLATLLMLYSFAYGELADNGDSTVTDKSTGFMWQQAEAGSMNWEAALVYCEDLELAGHDDWRLPNLNELLSIVDYEFYDPAIDTANFPGATSSLYWSSTTSLQPTANTKYGVHFINGNTGGGYFSNSFNARCMRGIQ